MSPPASTKPSNEFRQLMKDGIELTWAVNHLAPFLLGKLLLHSAMMSPGVPT
jgi:hypothetical protein